ncbi:hypothetical protein TNIN_100931 [Trichonephila inaurata madagascariensis]|uniref:Uncharacterized protein n=1 Tax=Trichonephila inaurata madagascariensis TaxID=2747483 RepID=A0A8X6X5J1_9ARAC|nr:hypothetical protein TNIN_100931 [Trichonephila inaurata madagascariensis]
MNLQRPHLSIARVELCLRIQFCGSGVKEGPPDYHVFINLLALSRVRSLDGLRILELDFTKLTGKTPCNENSMNEMERMRQLKPQAS